jgi:hypothetical protein
MQKKIAHELRNQKLKPSFENRHVWQTDQWIITATNP